MSMSYFMVCTVRVLNSAQSKGNYLPLLWQYLSRITQEYLRTTFLSVLTYELGVLQSVGQALVSGPFEHHALFSLLNNPLVFLSCLE